MRPVLLVALTFILVGCSKDEYAKTSETDSFSWTYNGRIYTYSIKDNVANAGAKKGINGSVSIMLDMSETLGGTIYFEKDCAYLEPLGSTVLMEQGCVLTERDGAGYVIPIDSTKVFIYQDGAFNVSFSNCVTKTSVDFFTGESSQYNDCAASGSFSLTLVNKNNVSIVISDGKVNLHHVLLN
jgi:hypothetical protein